MRGAGINFGPAGEGGPTVAGVVEEDDGEGGDDESVKRETWCVVRGAWCVVQDFGQVFGAVDGGDGQDGDEGGGVVLLAGVLAGEVAEGVGDEDGQAEQKVVGGQESQPAG